MQQTFQGKSYILPCDVWFLWFEKKMFGSYTYQQSMCISCQFQEQSTLRACLQINLRKITKQQSLLQSPIKNVARGNPSHLT
jgi:hypothetical protein